MSRPAHCSKENSGTFAQPRAGIRPPMPPAPYLLVGRLHAGQQDSVPLHELHEAVADGVAGSADSDGLHHARVPQLAHTQVPVEELPSKEPRASGLEAPAGRPALLCIFLAPDKGPERPRSHSR